MEPTQQTAQLKQKIPPGFRKQLLAGLFRGLWRWLAPYQASFYTESTKSSKTANHIIYTYMYTVEVKLYVFIC